MELQSSSDEREWADASTATNPSEDEHTNWSRSSSLTTRGTMDQSGFYLDDTIEGIPVITNIMTEPLHDLLSPVSNVIGDEASSVPAYEQDTPPPSVEALQQDSLSDEAGVTCGTSQPEGSGRAPPKTKNKSKTRKEATRSKGTQVDIRLIGSSWPRVKKTPANGEAGTSSTGTRQRSKKSKNQENPDLDTPIEGSHEDLNQENTSGTYTSQENLTISTSQPDLSYSDSSPAEIVENEQNRHEPTAPWEILSVIHEEPTDFEDSAVNTTQRGSESIIPAPEQHSIVKPLAQSHTAAPTPVIANLFINFTHSDLSSEARANFTIESNSHHNDSTVPINIQLPSVNHSQTNQGDNFEFGPAVRVGGPRATSSHYSSHNSLTSRVNSSLDTSGLDSRNSFDFLHQTMPPKTDKECFAGECEYLNKKPAAVRKAKTKPKASDKKSKPKKASKKKSRSHDSRRCYSSESDSYSDCSCCSSYSTSSCSCSDCWPDSSDYSSDNSRRVPSRTTKKKTTSASTIKRKKALKK